MFWFDFVGWDSVVNVECMLWVIVCVVGLCVKIDNEIGWYKMFFNVFVNGVMGFLCDVYWDL